MSKNWPTKALKTSISTALPCHLFWYFCSAFHVSSKGCHLGIYGPWPADHPVASSVSLSLSRPHSPFLFCGRFPAYLLIFTTSDVPSSLHNVFEIRIGWMNETYLKINSAAHGAGSINRVLAFFRIFRNFEVFNDFLKLQNLQTDFWVLSQFSSNSIKTPKFLKLLKRACYKQERGSNLQCLPSLP